MSGNDNSLLDRMPSGIAGLDVILGGGFLKGGLYIIQGPPGTGKTTIGNQVCFNHVADDRRALYVTLLAEYHARMMQHLRVMTFFDQSRIPDQITSLNGLRALHDEGLKGLLALLRREITTRDASLLVLDGIVSVRRAAGDEQAFNEFVHELQAIAIAANCTMFMLTSAMGIKVTPEHTMVDGIIELSDHLTEWSAESSLQVVKFRGGRILRGRHAFKITSDGVVVHPRIEALLARPSRPDPDNAGRLSSGIDQLDTMLGGGLPRSSTTMVMGPSGTGKTTLGLQFLARSSAAEPGLLFGFYETPARIAAKIAGVCRPLRGLIDSGAVQVQWQPPTDDLLDAHGETLLQMVHQRKVRRLFIDGLGALQAAAGGGSGRIGNFLTALMNEMRVLGVTTLFTIEVPDIMGPSIRTPLGDLSSLAENLILLRFIELRSRLYRLVSILKVRDSQFDPTLHEYTTSSEGLMIEATSDSAEQILVGYARGEKSEASAGRQPRERRGN
ncbi:RAD55 family ATPase [Rhodopila sp.]|uniref:RAD55 family ATPase n=1 Tax=Rhodopila sp. TaxID=2480087 RepID=UPI003D09C30A